MEKQSELGFLNHAVRFPSLAEADGIWPWNPVQLDDWAMEIGRDKKALHAARFILGRWNSGFSWECGEFDPKVAIECWDSSHRRVFLDLVTSNLGYSA